MFRPSHLLAAVGLLTACSAPAGTGPGIASGGAQFDSLGGNTGSQDASDGSAQPIPAPFRVTGSLVSGPALASDNAVCSNSICVRGGIR